MGCGIPDFVVVVVVATPAVVVFAENVTISHQLGRTKLIQF